MISKLCRRELDFKVTFEYFRYNLDGTNALSSAVIKYVDFNLGAFFTLLPEDADLNKMLQFQYGGIASGVRDQISHVILKKLYGKKHSCCIFDDATSTYSEGYDKNLFQTCGLNYGNEVYYSLATKKANIHLIDQCIYASDAIWHSLCIISDIVIIENKKEINLSDIINICKKSWLLDFSHWSGALSRKIAPLQWLKSRYIKYETGNPKNFSAKFV